MIGQNLVGVDATSNDIQYRSGQMTRMQEGADGDLDRKTVKTKEMQKESKMERCTLLNRSTWRTEKKYMKRHKGTFDIFFGGEQIMQKEEMEEQFNKEAKHGWRLAVDAARITMKMQAVRIASTLLQRKQGMQKNQTQKEEVRQQQRMKAMKDMTRKNTAKGRMDAKHSWWFSELLAADCEKSVAPFRKV